MCVVFVVGFVVIFAIGPGSIPWFLVSELFMQNARPMATSVAVGVNWGANFFVGLGFPILEVSRQFFCTIEYKDSGKPGKNRNKNKL